MDSIQEDIKDSIVRREKEFDMFKTYGEASEFLRKNGLYDYAKLEDVFKFAEQVKKILEEAHMAGQIDAGLDPSYSNAQNYVKL